VSLPTPQAEPADLATSLERLIAWVRQSRDTTDLSVSSISALSRLEDVGSLRITELARRESLSQPGLTTLINRLEEAGLVIRGSDPTDGRAVLVSITAAGVEKLREHRAARTRRIADRFGQLDPADQRSLLDATAALGRLAENPVAPEQTAATDQTDQNEREGTPA
jgi:DNA-binding MarR family transcriptional regulator